MGRKTTHTSYLKKRGFLLNLLDQRIFLFISFISLVLALLIARNYFHFFQHSSAQAASTFSQIQSTTYYEPQYDDSNPQLLADLTKDLPAIKAAGFNTVWLVSPWKAFEPIALPSPSYNDADSKLSITFSHFSKQITCMLFSL